MSRTFETFSCAPFARSESGLSREARFHERGLGTRVYPWITRCSANSSDFSPPLCDSSSFPSCLLPGLFLSFAPSPRCNESTAVFSVDLRLPCVCFLSLSLSLSFNVVLRLFRSSISLSSLSPPHFLFGFNAVPFLFRFSISLSSLSPLSLFSSLSLFLFGFNVVPPLFRSLIALPRFFLLLGYSFYL